LAPLLRNRSRVEGERLLRHGLESEETVENVEAEEEACPDFNFLSRFASVGSDLLALFGVALKMELMKLTSLPPGETGCCFTFFRLAQILDAADLKTPPWSSWPSLRSPKGACRISSLLAAATLVLTGLSLNGAKQEDDELVIVLAPLTDSVSENENPPELESDEMEVEPKYTASLSWSGSYLGFLGSSCEK